MFLNFETRWDYDMKFVDYLHGTYDNFPWLLSFVIPLPGNLKSKVKKERIHEKCIEPTEDWIDVDE